MRRSMSEVTAGGPEEAMEAMEAWKVTELAGIEKERGYRQGGEYSAGIERTSQENQVND